MPAYCFLIETLLSFAGIDAVKHVIRDTVAFCESRYPFERNTMHAHAVYHKREIPDFNYTSLAVSDNKLRTPCTRMTPRVSVRCYSAKIIFACIPKERRKRNFVRRALSYRFPFISPFLSAKKVRRESESDGRESIFPIRYPIYAPHGDRIAGDTMQSCVNRKCRLYKQSATRETRPCFRNGNKTSCPPLPQRNDDPEEVTFVRNAGIAASQINREHSSSRAERKIKILIYFFCKVDVNIERN